MLIQKKRIVAETDLDMMNETLDAKEVRTEDVVLDPEVSDLLFEAEDVAELLAEVTGEPVEVTADADQVTFAVGDEEFTVEPEGDEEVLESVRKPLRGKRNVTASRKAKVAASTKTTSKTVRKLPTKGSRK